MTDTPKERPILFSTAMVQAIMEGRKTQTRRVVKPQLPIGTIWNQVYDGELNYRIVDSPIVDTNCKCPYGQPGDLLWVRETWVQGKYKIHFAASVCNPKFDKLDGGWKPSIHMPKAAARIWLRITGMRVERLQDISEKDILSEGVQYPVVNSEIPGMVKPVFKVGEENGAINFMPDGWQSMDEKGKTKALLYAHWAELWGKINGLASWTANPWVWVIEFEVISKTGKP